MSDTAIVFNWAVPADHPAFAGHFPGKPILPGVVLLDRALLLAEAAFPGKAIRQIGNAKFLSPAAPGEHLRFSFRPGGRGSIAFEVDCTGRIVASGSLIPAS
ncbi:hypothetical protein [Thauera butanivorans]|uniref:hypothetical protein n=1 Tax=Thauera butanivorans TaxID=86174 RepID=UPI000839646A|nr:hypothetical protein [Thauera butanivorans]